MRIKILLLLLILSGCSSVKKSLTQNLRKLDYREKKDLTLTVDTDIKTETIKVNSFEGLEIIPESDSTDVIIRTPEGDEYKVKGAKKINLGKAKDSLQQTTQTTENKKAHDKGAIDLKNKEKDKESEKEKKPDYLGNFLMLMVLAGIGFFIYKRVT